MAAVIVDKKGSPLFRSIDRQPQHHREPHDTHSRKLTRLCSPEVTVQRVLTDNAAALMPLIAIAHGADQHGVSHATYDQLCTATGLSREKLSKVLSVLAEMKVIERTPQRQRSTYRLANFAPNNSWGKLPAKSMYETKEISAFKEFRLRRPTELNALKLFLLFVAFRDGKNNMASIGYDKILEYTAVERERIKSGISLLASLSIVYVEHVPSENSSMTYNAYRIVGVEPYRNMPTTGRASWANQITE